MDQSGLSILFITNQVETLGKNDKFHLKLASFGPVWFSLTILIQSQKISIGGDDSSLSEFYKPF